MLKSNLYKFIARATIGNSPIVREVFPELTDFAIVEKDNNFRKEVSATGKLTLVDHEKLSVKDFTLVKDCETNGIDTKINIDVYVSGVLKFQGYFYPLNAEFNNDKCTVTFSLITDDSYNCILKYYDTKENVLSEVDAWGLYRINPVVTFLNFVCEQTMVIETLNTSNTGCPEYYDVAGQLYLNIPVVALPYNVVSFPFIPESPVSFYFNGHALAITCLSDFIDPFSIAYGDTRISVLRVQKSEYEFLSWGSTYVRPVDGAVLYKANIKVKTTWAAENVITQNDPVTGAQNMPVGGGWIDYQTFYLNNILVTRWIRQPYYNNQVYNYAKTTDECNYKVYELIDPYINDPTNTLFIYRGRNLNDCITMFLAKSGCGLTFESKFLQDNINPVTNTANKLQKLQINNCSDIKYPDSSEPASILEFSFKDLLDNLENLLNAFWYISGNKFIIEHYSYFENGYTYGNNIQNVHNLKNIISKDTGKPEIIKSSRYTYNTEKIYNKERWSDVRYFYFDFSDIYIKYGLSTDNNELLRNCNFVVDVQAINVLPDLFSNDNVVLIAIQEQVIDITTGALGWVIVNEVGARTGELAVNGHLCWSNLIPVYWQHGRILLKGELNSYQTTFLSQNNKKVQNVTVSDCDDKFHVPEGAITYLGTGKIVGTQWDIVKKTKKIEIEI